MTNQADPPHEPDEFERAIRATERLQTQITNQPFEQASVYTLALMYTTFREIAADFFPGVIRRLRELQEQNAELRDTNSKLTERIEKLISRNSN